jgi:glycosyltransferase involved in cell wall biosynthesis
MKIAHVASYGPNTSGLYEAARDLARADYQGGHEVHLIDNGYLNGNKYDFVPFGTIDERGGFKLTTANPKILNDADIIIAHNFPHDEWIKNNNTPIIYVAHGRPLDSFRLEMNRNVDSYSRMVQVSKFDKVKKCLYFWPEYKPFWGAVFPEEKNLILDYPAIDEKRFSIDGPKRPIEDKNRGEFNILICDSWGRYDVDMFEIIHGVLEAAKTVKNFKLHFYGVEADKNGNIYPCWYTILQELQKSGCLGTVFGRARNMEEVYRSMDVVLTPHIIITRVIGEALLCGIPVIAANNCKVAQFTCDPHNPYDVARAIKEFVNNNQELNKLNALEQSKHLYLENYSREMNKVYDEILKGE